MLRFASIVSPARPTKDFAMPRSAANCRGVAGARADSSVARWSRHSGKRRQLAVYARRYCDIYLNPRRKVIELRHRAASLRLEISMEMRAVATKKSVSRGLPRDTLLQFDPFVAD
jgi:hypothetical protein